jgi:hypothetical protein
MRCCHLKIALGAARRWGDIAREIADEMALAFNGLETGTVKIP